METEIICPHCNTDMNSYKCEHTCDFCDTIYCLSCNKPFHIIDNNTLGCNKGHKKNCYNKNNILLSKL
jgi:hypothetical protein